MAKEKKYGEAEKLSAFNTAATITDWYILYYRIIYVIALCAGWQDNVLPHFLGMTEFT